MLDGQKDPENVLDEKDRDVFIVQVPDDKADNEEGDIDNNVVDYFVEKAEAVQSYIAQQNNVKLTLHFF